MTVTPSTLIKWPCIPLPREVHKHFLRFLISHLLLNLLLSFFQPPLRENGNWFHKGSRFPNSHLSGLIFLDSSLQLVLWILPASLKLLFFDTTLFWIPSYLSIPLRGIASSATTLDGAKENPVPRSLDATILE